MKKLAAILLLALFAFNMIGYQLLYQYMASKSDHRIETALNEAGYNEADLILIKQPHDLPYFTDSKEFQRIDGEVDVNGVIYKYVKYRIYNGFVEMLCVPHHQKMQIQQQKNNLAAVGGDFANHTEKKAEKSQKTPVWECDELRLHTTFTNTDTKRSYPTRTTNGWLNANSLAAEQPPELV